MFSLILPEIQRIYGIKKMSDKKLDGHIFIEFQK